MRRHSHSNIIIDMHGDVGVCTPTYTAVLDSGLRQNDDSTQGSIA